MNTRRVRAAAATTVLLLQGCASAGGGAGAGATDNDASSSAAVESFSKDVGLATAFDLERQTRRILERYQYEIIRFDEGAYTFVDTAWKPRPVLPDEQAMGIVAARTRILIRTRLRSRVTDETLAVHRVTFSAENMVRIGDADWQYGVMTEDFKDYLDRIATQFESEFRTGIRRNE